MAKIRVGFKMEAEERFIDNLVDPDSTLMYDMLDRESYPEITGIHGEASRLDDNEAALLYEMEVEDDFAKNEAKRWEHHLDYLIDLGTYDDITSIYDCEVVEVD